MHRIPFRAQRPHAAHQTRGYFGEAAAEPTLGGVPPRFFPVSSENRGRLVWTSRLHGVRFILDTSLTLAWYFADEANPYADAVAQKLASAEAIVPSLWPLEVANALVIGERRKRSTAAQASTFLARLGTLPIVIDDETETRA